MSIQIKMLINIIYTQTTLALFHHFNNLIDNICKKEKSSKNSNLTPASLKLFTSKKISTINRRYTTINCK